jgi:hypothetical protein
MFRVGLVLLLAVVSPSPVLVAQGNAQASQTPNAEAKPVPAWAIAAQQRHQELVRENGAGTDVALRDQLLKMAEDDQAARGFSNGKQTSQMTQEMIHQLPAIDTRLTLELKEIVQEKGWPTIALVGIDASNAAMLILTHTSDHAWQRQLLPQLQELADTNKIDLSPLALVIDKELVAEGKLQRYGSQFKFINGEIAMYAVENPANLDQRRARALLPPIDVYRDIMAQMYHLKVSDTVVMAVPPAQK